MEEIKYAVQAVILNDKGEVLAVSRKDDHNDMGLVGGKVDELDWQHNYLNPFQAAIKRECKEETGLDIDVETAEVVFQTHMDGYMGITYLIKDWSGEIKYDEPHDVKWVPFNEIIKGSFGVWNAEVLKSLVSMGVEVKYFDLTDKSKSLKFEDIELNMRVIDSNGGVGFISEFKDIDNIVVTYDKGGRDVFSLSEKHNDILFKIN